MPHRAAFVATCQSSAASESLRSAAGTRDDRRERVQRLRDQLGRTADDDRESDDVPRQPGRVRSSGAASAARMFSTICVMVVTPSTRP